MTKFNITTHKFELDNEEYFLSPLGGEDLDLLFSVLSGFQEVSDKIESEMPKDLSKEEKEKLSSAKFLTSIPPGLLKDLHKVSVKTFKESYPDKTDKSIEQFVTKNLFNLMNDVIKASMPTAEE